MENIYDLKEYKRSRKAYIAQCSFEYFITLLVADAFLANLLSNMGISDSLTGIISSFISFAFLFQLLSLFLVKKIKDTKKSVVIFNCFSQLLFMCIYIVPFMPISHTAKTALVIAFILFAYMFNYMISGVYFKWTNSFVEPTKRAEYSAVKERISLLCGIVFTFTLGYAIDAFNASGNTEGGFLFIAASMFVLTICNFVSLMMISKINKSEEKREITPSIREVLKNTVGNKNFTSVIIMTMLWYAARYMTIGFLGTFKTKDLAISVGAVQIINIISNLARFAVSKQFGKFSDRTSYATGIRIALIIEAAANLFIIFAGPKTWWCVIIYSVLYNISIAGSNQNSFNIAYSYVDSKYIVQAMAIKNSIGGIFGFLISLLGSKILSAVQANGNKLFGIHLYGQQLLAAVSFVILTVTVIYIKYVIEKQRVIIQ